MQKLVLVSTILAILAVLVQSSRINDDFFDQIRHLIDQKDEENQVEVDIENFSQKKDTRL